MTSVLLTSLLPALDRRFKAMKVGDTDNVRFEVPLELNGTLTVKNTEYEAYITVQTAAWLEHTNVIYVTIERKR